MVTINGVGFAIDPKKAGIGCVETIGPVDGKKSTIKYQFAMFWCVSKLGDPSPTHTPIFGEYQKRVLSTLNCETHHF